MKKKILLAKIAALTLLAQLTILPISFANQFELSAANARNVKLALQDLAQFELKIFVAQALTIDLIDRLSLHRSSQIDVRDSLFHAPTKNPRHSHLDSAQLKRFMNHPEVSPQAKEQMQKYLFARAQLRHQVIQSILNLSTALKEKNTLDNKQTYLQRLGNLEFIRGLEGENALVEMNTDIQTTLNALRLSAKELKDSELRLKWLRMIDLANEMTTSPDRFQVRQSVLKIGQLIQESLNAVDNGGDPVSPVAESRVILVRTIDWTHSPSDTANQFAIAYYELVQALDPNCIDLLQARPSR